MATYEVTTKSGKTYQVTTKDAQKEQSFSDQIPEIAKQAGESVLASSPANLTKKFFETDPATMQKVAGPALPILGGIVGNAPGAALGELARQATGTALAPETVPETALGRFASVATAGIAQEPKILNAIPGVPKVVDLAKRAGSSVGGGLARLGEAASGVPKREIERLFKSPGQVFRLGSKEKAGEAIGKAKALAGVNPGVTDDIATMTADNVSKATNVSGTGAKALEDIAIANSNKALPSVEKIGDALKHIDKEIKTGLRAGTDTSELQNIQKHLNSLLEEAAPSVQSARKNFAPLALRDRFLQLLPKNKDGSLSKANLFYLNSLFGGIGYAAGGNKGAAEGIGLGMLARAPLTTGLATVGAGGLNAIAQNPQARQVLLQVLQRLTQGKGSQNAQ